MICKLCDFNSVSPRSLAYHITHTHKITSQQYYDRFIGNEDEKICPICNNVITIFHGLDKGYNQFCSKSCGSKYKFMKNNFWKIANNDVIIKRNQQISDSKQQIKDYIIYSLNGILVQSLITLYGQVWYKHNAVPIKMYKKVAYVDKKYVKSIIKYRENCKKFKSSYEYDIYCFLKSFYKDEVQHNVKIGKREVDIYLPKINLIIDYNGKYWHDYRANDSDMNRKLYFNQLGQSVYYIEDCRNDYNTFISNLQSLKTYIKFSAI